MSIERLYRAALAAGFSMAAPDEEPGADQSIGRHADVPASTNLPAVITPSTRIEFRGLELFAPVAALGARLRGRISYLSGRATA